MSQHNRGVVALILITVLALGAVVACNAIFMDNNDKNMEVADFALQSDASDSATVVETEDGASSGGLLGATWINTEDGDAELPMLGAANSTEPYGDGVRGESRIYFVGWQCSGDGKLYRSFDDVPITMLNSTFTGKWGYKVTIHIGGKDGGIHTEVQYVPAGWHIEKTDYMIGKRLFGFWDMPTSDGGTRGGMFSVDASVIDGEMDVKLAEVDGEDSFYDLFLVKPYASNSQCPYASCNLNDNEHKDLYGLCLVGWQCSKDGKMYTSFEDVPIEMKGSTFTGLWGHLVTFEWKHGDKTYMDMQYVPNGWCATIPDYIVGKSYLALFSIPDPKGGATGSIFWFDMQIYNVMNVYGEIY